MLNLGTPALLRRSFVARRFMYYVSLSGVLYGLMNFGEVIARKSLGASALQVTLLTMTVQVSSLTSIWWGYFLSGRDQRRAIWVAGSVGLLAVASGAFLGTVRHLLLIYFVYNLAFVMFVPARNRVLQQHIPGKNMGGLFGLSQGLLMALAAVMSAVGGWWMDRVEFGWQHLFPLAAIVGFVSIAALATIPTHQRSDRVEVPQRAWLFGPWRDVFKSLRQRPDFLRFEGAFMLYGIAFMMLLPVVPIFLVDDLALGYGTIGIAKGAVAQITMIACIPLFGRFYDRTTPHRMAVVSFAFGSLHPLTLVIAKQLHPPLQFVMIIISFTLFGIAMSGVTVLWNLATIRFAGKDEDAGFYQSMHLTAVGIRGMFAPLLGYVIMLSFGKPMALLASSVMWVIAASAMVAARLWDRRTGAVRSLRAVD